MNPFFVAIPLIAIVVTLVVLYFRSRQNFENLNRRFAGILDIEAEVSTAKRQLDDAKRERQETIAQAEQGRARLNKEYGEALLKYDELKKEISLLEENFEDLSFGLYKPHFTFESAEKYKLALEKVRDDERRVIHEGRAAVCSVQWAVHDNKAEGKRMMKQYLKLIIRAFNGECDAAVANVSWNNITKMEERVTKSFEAINQLGSVMQMSLTREYLKLKLDELRLTHEYEEKKYQEREEQRRIREQIREEEKAQRELEQAKQEAEQKEAEYQKALQKAREEADKATGAHLQKLTAQIAALQLKFDEVRKIKERAIARAQLTKSGFVYVISNIGSFGDGVLKVGMTRRLEPMERVIELGDASVPFAFDVHAMLYSDDAPALEAALHQMLEERRVNLINPRKEFYHSVELEEIEGFVKERGLSAQFIKLPEAKEYRESVAIRAERTAKKQPQPTESEKFAKTLFASAGSD